VTTAIPSPRTTGHALDESALQRLSDGELDTLFRASPAGPIPRGRLSGTALLLPGTALCAPLARLVRLLAWRGKEVDDSGGSLRNLVGPLGTRAVRALVSRDRSLVDSAECVLIDYSTTSAVAAPVRDEIRSVGPGLYLGVVWVSGRRTGWFALRQDAPVSPPASTG